MTPIEKLQQIELNTAILNYHGNDHTRRKYIRDIITAELLKYLVIDKKYPSNYIGTLISDIIGIRIDAGYIIHRCKELNIKTFSIKESANLKSTKVRKAETCIKKYGSSNPLGKQSPIYKKRNQTVQEKYGVSNVFQLDSVKMKTKDTMIKKYGVSNPVYMENYKRNCGRRSKIHTTIETLLIDLNIQFESEKRNMFSAFNKYYNKIYSPQVDILLNDYNIVIEINGDLWHANPKKYKATDLIPLRIGQTEAQIIWARDAARTEQIKSFGFEVIELWEHDIKTNLSIIKEQLYEKIYKNNKNYED